MYLFIYYTLHAIYIIIYDHFSHIQDMKLFITYAHNNEQTIFFVGPILTLCELEVDLSQLRGLEEHGFYSSPVRY